MPTLSSRQKEILLAVERSGGVHKSLTASSYAHTELHRLIRDSYLSVSAVVGISSHKSLTTFILTPKGKDYLDGYHDRMEA